MRIASIFVCLLFLGGNTLAQEVEEIVVTGSRVSSSLPGKHLRRNADNLLLRVLITNDSRDESQRRDEIHQTLRAGLAAADKNKRFVSDLKMVGRTQVHVDGEVDVSIVNPAQYRVEAIRLFAEDVRAVTAALGDDYRVIVSGIDKPIEWTRAGSLTLAIFIPYEYMVVPTSVSGVTIIPDY